LFKFSRPGNDIDFRRVHNTRTFTNRDDSLPFGQYLIVFFFKKNLGDSIDTTLRRYMG